MAEPRTYLKDVVAEKTTCRITGTLVDELGVVLEPDAITTLTLTLYALTTGYPVINSNTDVDVKNANQGTLLTGGLLTLTLTPLDNAIQDITLASEMHRALLKWTWASPAKAGAHEIDFKVRNLDKVT